MRAPLWLVERACTRKRVYTTKAQAKQAKQAMAAKAQRPFTIYQCPPLRVVAFGNEEALA